MSASLDCRSRRLAVVERKAKNESFKVARASETTGLAGSDQVS